MELTPAHAHIQPMLWSVNIKHSAFDSQSYCTSMIILSKGLFTPSTFLVKVSCQTLTNYGQSTVYTIKAFKVFNCTFMTLAGNAHNTAICPGKWIYVWDVFCFWSCIFYYIIIRRRLGTRQKHLLTRLRHHSKCRAYDTLLQKCTQLILQNFPTNVHVYLFKFTCIMY